MKSYQFPLVVWCLFIVFQDVNAIACKEEVPSTGKLKILPYQEELSDILSAFDKNDVERMENMLNILENKETNEIEEDSPLCSDDELRFVPNRIKEAGYPAEVHEVITDDGYILNMFRLPHGHGEKAPTTNVSRPPVLMMHGLYDSSSCWIALGSANSLGFLLADAGYDVWLANARGTGPSRKHVRLSPTGLWQKKYWSFSFHEIGVFDIPAMIDHILSKTDHKKLNYIGFSQGTTAFSIMASMRPEYNDKLTDVHLLAPVTSLDHQYNKLYKFFAHYYKPLKRISEAMRIYKLTTSGDNYFMNMLDIFCQKYEKLKPCKLMNSLIDSNQANCTAIQDMLVGGGSLRQSWHYLQMIRNGGFHLFDFEDKKTNMRIYGSKTPPVYNLTKITAPVNLYYSKDDDTATIKDAVHFQNQLTYLRSSYLVPMKDFRHIDFGYSNHVYKALNYKLIEKMNQANGL